MDNFSIKLDFMKFRGAKLVTAQGRKGVFIPVDENQAIYVGSKGVYLNLSAIELSQESKCGDTHLVKGNIDKKTFDAMTEDERRSQPILGNMRPLRAPEMAAQAVQFDDDLPE